MQHIRYASQGQVHARRGLSSFGVVTLEDLVTAPQEERFVRRKVHNIRCS